jgi:hypothetical protein
MTNRPYRLPYGLLTLQKSGFRIGIGKLRRNVLFCIVGRCNENRNSLTPDAVTISQMSGNTMRSIGNAQNHTRGHRVVAMVNEKLLDIASSGGSTRNKIKHTDILTQPGVSRDFPDVCSFFRVTY